MLQLRNHAFGAAAALAASLSLQAQCYEPLTGSSIGTGDDVVLGVQALGFAFPFGGTTFTDVHVSTNGFVYLSNASVPAPGGALCCAGATAGLVAGSPKVCPYWSDLNAISGTGTVKYNALPGKAVITWENVVEFGNTVQFSVQMQLHASGQIDFAYDGRCAIRTAGDFLVGMSEANAAALPGASDFSTVGVSATTTNFELFNNVGLNYDLAGQTLSFFPSGLGYAWVPASCASSNNAYGTGCYSAFASFYENFATAAAFDLANTSMTMLLSGSGYVMLPGITTYVAPTGAATSLVLTDDSETTVTLGSAFAYPGGSTSALTVCSNGFVSVATGNGTGFTPAVATFLSAPQSSWRSWHDLNPASAGSGQVKFEEVGSVSYVTWDGVFSFGTTNPETFQIQFDRATGNVHFVWQTIGGFGNGFLVGYSPGGASADSGNLDISAALPATFATVAADQLPLSMTAAPAPIPGGTVTFTTNDIPEFAPAAGLYVAVHILSLGQIPPPGLDLGFIGAPGCPAFVQTLDLTQAMVGASNSQSVSLTLPGTVSLGTVLYSQSAALFAPFSLPNGQNAFGLSTSNGMTSTVGAW